MNGLTPAGAENPITALVADVLDAVGPVFGGLLPLALSRTAGTGGYDRASNRHAAGAPLTWQARGFWRAVSTPAEQAGGATGAGLVTRRVLMVVGESLTVPEGAAPADGPMVPAVGDVVTVGADPRAAYPIDTVTPLGAPGGGLAPLYQVEARF